MVSTTVDFTPALEALSALMRDTIQSADPRRFVIVHHLSKTAQQLIRTVAVRVEDFGDPNLLRPGSGFFKSYRSQHVDDVAVPETLNPEITDVLESMTRAVVVTLASERPARFSEVERMTETAQSFLAAIAPKPLEKGMKEEPGDNEIVCEDAEDGYVRHALEELRAENIDDPRGHRLVGGGRRAVDENQLRREIVGIEGTKRQMEAELLQAQVAAAEAADQARDENERCNECNGFYRRFMGTSA